MSEIPPDETNGYPATNGYQPTEIISPGLYRGNRDTSAYEVKFLLTDRQARDVEQMLLPEMEFDRHADPALGHSYRVTSLYFDTDAMDVYLRTDGYRGRKYRVRRYGSSPAAYFERKTKHGQRVRKLRSLVPLDPEAIAPPQPADAHPAAWFNREVGQLALKPVCQVTYERVAIVGINASGPFRVTMDRAARGIPAGDAAVPATEAGSASRYVAPFDGGLTLLDDDVIVEFKFMTAMPALFKDTIAALQLSPQSVSKYRRCVEAAGLAAGTGEHA
jgi:hypothetical protein